VISNQTLRAVLRVLDRYLSLRQQAELLESLALVPGNASFRQSIVALRDDVARRLTELGS
jgi:hypothetical protein